MGSSPQAGTGQETDDLRHRRTLRASRHDDVPAHHLERVGQVRPVGASRGRHPRHSGAARPRHPTVLCGDFNADPDSDELRMLTGKSIPATPGLVFYDAWTAAGNGQGGGHTWTGVNPWAAPALWPDRRIDHVLSA